MKYKIVYNDCCWTGRENILNLLENYKKFESKT